MLASKGHPFRMKKSGTAETIEFNVFVSLNWQSDGNVFFVGKIPILYIYISEGVFIMRTIKVTDITLKKLSEDRAISLLFREKSAIAKCADILGADIIELPAVKNLREDTIIYKTIAQNVQNASLAIPVGFNKEDLSSTWECIKEAKKPRLQVELPVSTIQMEYTYHLKQSAML